MALTLYNEHLDFIKQIAQGITIPWAITLFWGLLLLQKNVRCVVLPHSDGCAIGVVEEVKDIILIGHTDKLETCVIVVINYSIDCLTGAKSVKVIGIGNRMTAAGCRS